MSDLRVYRVSTTALVTVHTTVKARDAEHALDVAGDAPRSSWCLGELFGDIDIADGEVLVVECEEGADE